MRMVGIIGGIASGKTAAAKELERLGAKTINADAIGQEVLTDPAVKKILIDRWGRSILDPAGAIDRSAVARLVFAPDESGPKELEFLESITHPQIKKRIESEIERLQKEGKTSVIILDAAVLLKSNWASLCDTILFIDAPREVRLSRAMKRGWSEAEFSAREGAQTPVAEKKRRASQIIKNSGNLQDLTEQIRLWWNSIDTCGKR